MMMMMITISRMPLLEVAATALAQFRPLLDRQVSKHPNDELSTNITSCFFIVFLTLAVSSGKRLCVGLMSVRLSVRLSVPSINRSIFAIAK